MFRNGSPDQQTLSAAGTSPLRLVLACGPCFLSDALVKALKDDAVPLEVRVGCGAEAVVRLASDGSVDAILLDARHRGDVATVRLIRAGVPDVPIIAFGLKDTEEDIVRWAQAGVAGFIPATVSLNEFLPTVADVLSGEQPCSDRMAAILFRRVASGARDAIGRNAPPPIAELTRREREIAEQISVGLSDKEISRRLSISLATTKSHVHNLLGKLNLRRRGQVAAVLRDPYQQSGRAA